MERSNALSLATLVHYGEVKRAELTYMHTGPFSEYTPFKDQTMVECFAHETVAITWETIVFYMGSKITITQKIMENRLAEIRLNISLV